MGAEESTLGGDDGAAGNEISILVNTIDDASVGDDTRNPQQSSAGGKGNRKKGKGKAKKPKGKKEGAPISEVDKDKLSRAFRDSQRKRRASLDREPPSPGYGGKPGGPKWRPISFGGQLVRGRSRK